MNMLLGFLQAVGVLLACRVGAVGALVFVSIPINLIEALFSRQHLQDLLGDGAWGELAITFVLSLLAMLPLGWILLTAK